MNKLQRETGVKDLSVDQVYRLGRPTEGKTRAIKIILEKLSDRDKILKTRSNCVNVRIQENLPPEVLKMHKTIGALVYNARRKGSDA